LEQRPGVASDGGREASKAFAQFFLRHTQANCIRPASHSDDFFLENLAYQASVLQLLPTSRTERFASFAIPRFPDCAIPRSLD